MPRDPVVLHQTSLGARRGHRPIGCAAAAIAGVCLAVVLGWPSAALAQDHPEPVFAVASPDGSSSVRLRLAAQLRLEHVETGLWSDADDLDTTIVRLRRVRPELHGNLFGEDLRFVLHLSTAPASLELIDLYVDYRFSSFLSLQIGQQKIPFTRYRLGSWKDRPVVEWSYETRYFGAERQFGVMAHNGVGKPPPWEYQLGVFGGANARASNAIGIPLTYAEAIPNPSDLAHPSPPPELHPELAGHFSFNQGGIDPKRPSDLEGGGFRSSTGLSAAWDLDPTLRQDTTLRVAPEILIKIEGWSFNAVGYLGTCELSTGTEDHRLCMVGSVLQVSRVFAKRYEIAARHAGVLLRPAFRHDARRWADARIAGASDPDEAAALTERYANVGSLLGEHEVNLGFNVYLFGTTLKWQIDAGLLFHDREGEDENRYDLQGRTQLQLGF